MTEPSNDDLRAVYQQVCESYRAIDEIRTKLLGLLPLATGAGILVLSRGGDSPPDSAVSAAAGIFGLVATLGLFSYELHGIKKCASLIDSGSLMEERLNIYGQFKRRPQEVAGFIDEPVAGSIIYSVSLAGWAAFALFNLRTEWILAVVATTVFAASVCCSIWLIRSIEADFRARRQYEKEPYQLRKRPADRSPLPESAYIQLEPTRTENEAPGTDAPSKPTSGTPTSNRKDAGSEPV